MQFGKMCNVCWVLNTDLAPFGKPGNEAKRRLSPLVCAHCPRVQEEHELNLNISISYSLTQVKSNALCFYIRRYWACESLCFTFDAASLSRSISICTKLIVRLKQNKMRSMSSFELRTLVHHMWYLTHHLSTNNLHK